MIDVSGKWIQNASMSNTTERGTPAQIEKSEPADNAESSLIAEVQKANSPAALKALREQWMKPAPEKPAEQVAEAEQTVEEAPAEAAPETTPESEETPPTESETPATEETAAPEATAETEETEDEDDGGEGPIIPHSGKRAHLRLAPTDQVGRLAASFLKRNRDWTMEDAINAAKSQLGIKDPAEKGSEDAAAKPSSNLPGTIAEVDSEAERLEDEHIKLQAALDFEGAAKILKSLRQLDRHRAALEKQSEREQAQQATAYNTAFEKSEAKAVELYPFVSDANSAAAKRMLEIDAELKANSDPLWNSPDKPLKVAQMVAAEMSIAPKKKGAPAPAKPAAVPPKALTAAPKGVVPSGGSRTTPITSTQPAVDATIKAAPNTIAGIRQLRQKLGLPV